MKMMNMKKRAMAVLVMKNSAMALRVIIITIAQNSLPRKLKPSSNNALRT